MIFRSRSVPRPLNLLVILIAASLASIGSCNPVGPVYTSRERSWLLRSVRDNHNDGLMGDEVCFSMDLENATASIIRVPGRTTALFKFDEYDPGSWELRMILELKERFSNRGLLDVNFVLKVPHPNDSENATGTTLPTPNNRSNVTLLYNAEDLESLPDGMVNIFDSCANVVFQVFRPWSSMEFAYVKAAILSAIFDQPCQAVCDDEVPSLSNRLHPLFENNPWNKDVVMDLDTPEKESKELRQVTVDDEPVTPSEVDVEDRGYLIPIRVIIPAEHVHQEDGDPVGMYRKYNYFVLTTDNQANHSHLDSDPPEIVWRDSEAREIPLEKENVESLGLPTITTTLEASTTSTAEETTISTTSVASQTTESGEETTTQLVTEENTEKPTSSSAEEPYFGLSGSMRVAFSLMTTTSSAAITESTSFASTTPTSDTVTPIGDNSSKTTPAETATSLSPVQYMNSARDKYRVVKQYRFGDESNPGYFDEIEIMRDKVKTFITQFEEDNDSASGQEKPKKVVLREFNEHYEMLLNWLDYSLAF